MKWNGIVSQVSQASMPATFAAANAPHASSTRLGGQAIAGMADGLDGRARAELQPEAPDADLDHVRAWVEVEAPDLGEQPLAADDLAGAADELVEQTELAVREVG